MLYYVWKLHIDRAIAIMESKHTKGAPIVAKVLKSAKINGVRKGYREE